ncbi:hypothetical protein PC129_g5591 [Phytophthora cactorum]|uniref:Elicitin n=1 Tax=Phytophthora cactorum TaxID=29920 RepID=A0A8T0Z8T5_9STRA|nr:hypothetical protein PC113_g9660 [Phytophthora cactorum]KAG2909474.1 hypothetical protein PC114_g10124 [Phytophthora cactorum]KAG2924759.1 hypothetical protein PC115_g8514 [Phytophthora cactorum]KAG3223732.1 hypothetical protein PC129_g5591 [Phytophthora cactorum]
MMPSLSVAVVISLTLISGVSAADDACATTDLVGIAGSPHVAGCSADAAFSSISTISELTTEQIQVICASSACTALMKDIGALGLGDCRIPETKIYLQTDIIDAFTEKCSALDSSSSSAGSVTTDNLREGSSSVTSSATTLIMRCIATATMALAQLPSVKFTWKTPQYAVPLHGVSVKPSAGKIREGHVSLGQWTNRRHRVPLDGYFIVQLVVEAPEA